MTSGKQGPCIVVGLNLELQLGRNLQWPLSDFLMNGTLYHATDFGNFTDFYDWLRASDGTLLGVRYWLRDDLVFLEQTTQKLNYVKSEPGRNLEIYFFDRRDVDPQRSCDQQFLYDAIFRSDEGSYAIGFGTERFTDSDMARLEASGVEWARVQEQARAHG